MPSCSVIIPTRDRPLFLLRAVQSALRGLPADGEVIVVDDSDQTSAESSLGKIGDGRLRVIANTGRRGSSGARNRGLRHARGAILFFLDDDDELLSGYCQHVLTTALTGDDLPDFGTAAVEVVRAGRRPVLRRRGLREGLVPVDAAFRSRTFAFSSGLWLRRETHLAAGPLLETLATNSDTEYSCRLMSLGLRQWFSARPGVRYHCHQDVPGQLGQMTRRLSRADRAEAFATIIQRHRAFLLHDGDARRFLVRRHLQLAAKAGVRPMPLADLAGATRAERILYRAWHAGFVTIEALARSALPRSRGKDA